VPQQPSIARTIPSKVALFLPRPPFFFPLFTPILSSRGPGPKNSLSAYPRYTSILPLIFSQFSKPYTWSKPFFSSDLKLSPFFFPTPLVRSWLPTQQFLRIPGMLLTSFLFIANHKSAPPRNLYFLTLPPPSFSLLFCRLMLLCFGCFAVVASLFFEFFSLPPLFENIG